MKHPCLNHRRKSTIISASSTDAIRSIGSPTLKDMATGQVDGVQVCKERASRQSIYPHVRTLIDKGYIKENFYRNKPYWTLADDNDE